ncbi:MAG: thioredoxin family protein [Vulcanimicrobiota bacterium]
MKKNRILCALLSLFLLTGVALADKSGPTWYTDWNKAAAAAKKENKPILMDFTGSDWCGWCIKLHDEVFSKDEFKTWASKNAILMVIDFPRKSNMTAAQKSSNQALARKYGIRGYPTIVVVDAAGKKQGQLGYVAGGPSAWIKEAQKQMK